MGTDNININQIYLSNWFCINIYDFKVQKKYENSLVQSACGVGIPVSAVLRHYLLKMDYGKIKHHSDIFKLKVSGFKSFCFFVLWAYLEHALAI